MDSRYCEKLQSKGPKIWSYRERQLWWYGMTKVYFLPISTNFRTRGSWWTLGLRHNCTSLLGAPIWSPPVWSNTKHSQTNCSRVSHSSGCHGWWGRDSGNGDKSKTPRLTMKLKRPRLPKPSTLQFQIAPGLWHEVHNGILAEYQPLHSRSLAQSCSSSFWEASGAIHGSEWMTPTEVGLV
jgi:hypothetical protein